MEESKFTKNLQEIEMDRELSDLNEIPPKSPVLANSMFYLCFPFCCPFAFWVLEPRRAGVVINWGTFTRIQTDPGIHFDNPVGREIRIVSTAQISRELPDEVITDSLGNPIICSAVIIFRIINPVAAVLNVQNVEEYILTQAKASLKFVLSKYPFEQIKVEGEDISTQLIDNLKPRVIICGATICSFSLKDLTYSPEIAQTMLKKQAAIAFLDARELIVKGAVDIATRALEQLDRNGVKMRDEEKFSLVSSLLVVTCGEREAIPTIGIQNGARAT